ncbi:MAG: type II secretion system protein GspK [Fimbriiglobus sp.]|nr:type II secretion system protein GspK [Fimbriiglobus sp.]
MIRRSLVPPDRRGYALYIVLVVVVVLTLVAYEYADTMGAEATAAIRSHELEQAKANAASGVHFAAALLTDPNSSSMNLDDDASLFSAQPVGTGNLADEPTSPRALGDANRRRGGGRFSLLNLSDTTGGTDGSYPGSLQRFGLEDEGRKLNVNALIQIDPTGVALYTVLMALPNMTSEIAGAIVDWVDADASEYPSGGAEDEFYMGLQPPYHCKNGPLNSVDELLLVKGVTPDLLFGSDLNRNGVQDANETATGTFSRGWSEYLTCYGRELSVDSLGNPRVFLNNTDLQTLDADLMAIEGMTRELADYILYYRISRTGTPVAPLAANQVAGNPADLRTLVDAAVQANNPPRRSLASVFTVLNTQIPLSPIRDESGRMVTPVVACPLNDPTLLASMSRTLLDRCTTSEDYELFPRVNVNTAPREVLVAIGKLARPATSSDTTLELTESDVDAILSNRPSAGTDPTASWLVTTAGINPTKFKNLEKFICGRSGAYRVRSVGYFANPGGPQASVEAVIEVVAQNTDGSATIAMPRIVYFRDTTDLGRVFADLPR